MTSQGNSNEKEHLLMCYNTWLQTSWQSHSNKSSIALTQKQTWRSMENKVEDPHIKLTELHPSDFWPKKPKTYAEEKTAYSTNDSGITLYPPTEYWN
jgi:hypothetical protein